MLEKMLETAKEHAKAYGCGVMVRLDMQYNSIECAWSARVFYSDNHIIDIRHTENGIEVYKVQ